MWASESEGPEFTGGQSGIGNSKGVAMILGLMSMMLVVAGQDTAAPAQPAPTAIYKSKKTLAELQTCLTDRLSEIGEVVAVNTEQNSTTLLVRDNPDGPMTIDIGPQSVMVTSKFITGSQALVKACL